MIVKMWRSTDGLSIVWEVNPGMLFSWDAVAGFVVPLTDSFRTTVLENSHGGYEQVYG